MALNHLKPGSTVPPTTAHSEWSARAERVAIPKTTDSVGIQGPMSSNEVTCFYVKASAGPSSAAATLQHSGPTADAPQPLLLLLCCCVQGAPQARRSTCHGKPAVAQATAAAAAARRNSSSSSSNSSRHVPLQPSPVPHLRHPSRYSSRHNTVIIPHASAATEAPPEVSESAFDELAAGTARKYIMISGKGGVGKTSLSASLAVRLAAAGHTTLVVSTDPAHSLSDSLDQDVSGGKPVLLQGVDLPLWGLEVDVEEGKREFASFNSSNNTGGQVSRGWKGAAAAAAATACCCRGAQCLSCLDLGLY